MTQRSRLAVAAAVLVLLGAAGIGALALGTDRGTPGAPAATPAGAPVAATAVAVPHAPGGFPRPTIFRTGLEDLPQQRATHEQGVSVAGPYDLVIAKALDEEVLGRDAVAPYLRAIKAAAPEKIVLDHFLLSGRNPASKNIPVWPGHWLMLEATAVTSDLADGTQVTVADGAALRAGEDAQIVALTRDGQADFTQVEEVRVTALSGNRVTLERARAGTERRRFAAGRASIATHASVTYNETTGPIWKYTFCREAPRDPQGRRLIEALADVLAAQLKPGALLAGLDGYQFDVAAFSTTGQNQGRRRIDCDRDGKPDSGYIGGVSSYGLGVVEFQQQMRTLVGERVYLISEATGWWASRDVTFANGIENESFPDLHRWEQFSSAYERYQFWRRAARTPRLSYLQLKETTQAFTRCPDQDRGTNWKFRLALGAALLGDGYFAYLSTNEEGQPRCNYVDPVTRSRVAYLDEFAGGALRRPHYLGQPLGEAQRIDLRAGAPEVLARDFEQDLGGATVVTARGAAASAARDATGGADRRGALQIDVSRLSADPDDEDVRARLGPIAVRAGREYTLSLQVRADPGYERLGAAFAAVPRRVAFVLNGGNRPSAVQDVMADGQWRTYTLAFIAPADDANATLEVQLGREAGSTWLDGLRIQPGPADTFFRDFQGGAVLVNGSSEAATFDLDALAPGRALRRLQGTQDPAVNNGALARGKVAVPARDALILVD